ncbi:hypothetical protein DV738_g5072, partial [Chaetothyriales sp. CBS 135597]
MTERRDEGLKKQISRLANANTHSQQPANANRKRADLFVGNHILGGEAAPPTPNSPTMAPATTTRQRDNQITRCRVAQPLLPRPTTGAVVEAQPSQFGPHHLLTIGPATHWQQQTTAVHFVQLLTHTFSGAVICCLSSSYPRLLLQNRVHHPASEQHRNLSTPVAVAFEPAAVSRPQLPRFDDLYEYYDPEAEAESRPQRQQAAAQSPVGPWPRPPSARSPGATSLRRTRRLHGLPATAAPAAPATATPPRPTRNQSPNPGVAFEQSGSTSPEGFQRLVDDDSYWPHRTPHVSRRTHDAILFALEAIRTGRGVDAHPLTSDLTEERARMSDLLRDNGPSGTPLGRAQNGSGQLPQEAPRMRTPRDILLTLSLLPAGSSPPVHTTSPVPPRPQPLYRVPRVPRLDVQPSATYARAGSRFPHAFERWEQLSAQWEGLTSHWLRRLQNNATELESKPLEQQMARQIADLSAAGANLFHAVVELQRLRASSERKFQRWFFETREEQEQAAERQAELERQLRAERDARITAQAAGTDAAVRAEKARAEELVREMRRELQISKEEARRAWEELGRREQEERERTIALRSGEPTLIGGVQVVPMQAVPSRQLTAVASSSQRPPTRDGPTYRAAPAVPGQVVSGQQPANPSGNGRPASRTTSTSLDSPGEEARQFTYQQPHLASASSTTDPFTEPGPQQPHTELYPPHAVQQSSSAAAARSTSSPHQSPPSTLPGAGSGASAASRFYQQPSPQTTIHQPLGTLPTTSPQAATASQHTRPLTASDAGGSASVLSADEEYHINPDGSYTLDSSGRRIPYNQPISEQFSVESEAIGEITGQEVEESDEDYASDIAREQAYAQEHPTRLSDILEEQTSRTSPSRGSFISGSAAGGGGGPR